MSRGYTVMEVMISLGLLGVGAGGVIALQKATQIGNNSARNVATANAVALSWAERLRAESLRWNAPAGVDDLQTDTKWLNNAKPDDPIWVTPEEVPLNSDTPAGSPVADLLGNDIFSTNPAHGAFCTKLRLTRLMVFPDNAVKDPNTSQIIRAEIRVFWDRAGAPINDLATPAECIPIPDPGDPGSARFGFVTLTTAVLQNPAP